jgi:hypothetical protein
MGNGERPVFVWYSWPLMASRLLAVVLLVTTLGADTLAQASLDGCPLPTTLASGLKTLRARGWIDITPAELLRIWPTALVQLECEPGDDRACLYGRRGRVHDYCECCETFDFDLVERPGAPPERRLRSVFIFYSAETYAEAESVGTQLARAMGLPENSGRIGPTQPQPVNRQFFWTENSTLPRRILDVQISHERLWTVYLALGFQP